MIRDVMGVMEILSFLYMVSASYGQKMKYNIYAVVFIVLELLLLSGMNNHGLSSYLLGFSYLLMFLYCLINYKLGIKRSVVNCVLASVVVSIIQMLSYFLISFIDTRFQITVGQKEMLVSILYFVFILLFSKQLHLNEVSNFFIRKNKLLYMVSIFILVILGSQIWRIKREHIIDGKIVFSVVYFALLLIVLIWEWQKTRNEAEKRKAQLELNRIYFDAYEGLIQSIRERQHDFKNHLSAIEGMIYSIDDYDQLIEEQKKYLNNVLGEMETTKLLTLVENPLIAGFLNYKVSMAKKMGIKIQYDCILQKSDMKIPEYQVIEMMGILLDNAIDALDKREVDDKILGIKLAADTTKMYFIVFNTYEDSENINVQRFFEYGYSSKGVNRGIGLSKLKRMIDENDGQISVYQEKIENLPIIKIQLLINI